MLIHTLHSTRIDRIDPHSLFVLRRLLQDEEIELPSGDKLQRHAIDESKRIHPNFRVIALDCHQPDLMTQGPGTSCLILDLIIIIYIQIILRKIYLKCWKT